MEADLYLKQLKSGDQQAISMFVKSNSDRIFKTCLAYVQSVPDAEDITQEVFIKAFESIQNFKGDSKLSSWLIRIAINLSLNYLRDNKKRLNQLDVSEIELSNDSEDTQKKKEVKKAVRYAVFKLPEKQRKVFILSFYLKLSYKEIEEVTGYSISSIESLLFRARKKLRELLELFYKELHQ